MKPSTRRAARALAESIRAECAGSPKRIERLAEYFIRPEDVGQSSARLPACECCKQDGRRVFFGTVLGTVLPQDVGRRLVLLRYGNGAEVWQAESDLQRREREAGRGSAEPRIG